MTLRLRRGFEVGVRVVRADEDEADVTAHAFGLGILRDCGHARSIGDRLEVDRDDSARPRAKWGVCDL